jgi:putative Mg2+ transporter-C (MgtC) family protein
LIFLYRQSLSCSFTDQIIATLRPTTTAKVVTVPKIQYWRQVGQIFLAFGLTSLVGLERQLRGKSAGLRTHSIVGTTSALILQVSKYGFSDVIRESMVVLDPSRIAAQIISGISFLGAGLIITRQAAIRGLTTAASVWSAAAIGMAAGSGLWLLSLAVTGFHFVILLGFLPLEKRLPVFDTISALRAKADDEEEEGDEDEDSHSV